MVGEVSVRGLHGHPLVVVVVELASGLRLLVALTFAVGSAPARRSKMMLVPKTQTRRPKNPT